MAGLAPPRYAPDVSRPPAEQVAVGGSDFGTTVRVRLTVRPGTPGPNRFTVRVVDFDTDRPIRARQVRLRFALPGRSDVGTTELILDRRGPGVWESRGANLSVDGRWRVGVLVEQAADSVEVPLEVRTRLPEQDITVSEAPGQPTLSTVRLPGGISVQGYVDPGAPGPNELHFTFFSPEGGEQPVDSPRVTAELDPEPPVELETRELAPGHFVASIDLIPGRWRFRVDAATPDGAPLSAYFEQRIGEEQA
jgi:nitrogen fixation protein FixH